MKKNMLVTVFILAAAVILSACGGGESEMSNSGTGSNANASNTGSEERTYTCPRCDGDGICWRCKGEGTYYNSVTGENKPCALCRDSPGDCGTCDGYGYLKDSTYNQVMANERRRAENSKTREPVTVHEETVYCRACSTTGRCAICDGSGVYRNGFDFSQELPCTACTHGSVEDIGKCQICGGDGIVNN